jgi:transposase-like protein
MAPKHRKTWSRTRDEYRAYCPRCKEACYEFRPKVSRSSMRFVCKKCRTRFMVEGLDFLYEDEMLVGC